MSWYQPEPTVSMEMFYLLGVGSTTAIVDVGGGASLLTDRLIDRGFTDLSVLDISVAALDHCRDRMGSGAPVTLLRQDVLTWQPPRRFGLWHDRAVFHFLVDHEDRDRYLRVMGEALAPGSAVVLATFAEDGPESCSGLPVARYPADRLSAALGRGFDVVAARREIHTTPSGTVQPFTWVAARTRTTEYP